MDKPILSKQAFWDVDMDKIDYEKNALFAMERVVNDGTIEDFVAIDKFYGRNRFKKEIVNSKTLGPKEISFCCLILKLKAKDFKYVPNRPAYPQPWDYSGA